MFDTMLVSNQFSLIEFIIYLNVLSSMLFV